MLISKSQLFELRLLVSIQTDAVSGEVRGCIRPEGFSSTIYHAKPVIIQGAWLSCLTQEDILSFEEYLPKMEALLGYANALI